MKCRWGDGNQELNWKYRYQKFVEILPDKMIENDTIRLRVRLAGDAQAPHVGILC